LSTISTWLRSVVVVVVVVVVFDDCSDDDHENDDDDDENDDYGSFLVFVLSWLIFFFAQTMKSWKNAKKKKAKIRIIS